MEIGSELILTTLRSTLYLSKSFNFLKKLKESMRKSKLFYIYKAHSLDINVFTAIVHDWLDNFGEDYTDDNLRYKMISQFLCFEISINMQSIHHPIRRTQILHITSSAIHKTFFHVSSLTEHVMFELFQFHTTYLQQHLDTSQAVFSQQTPELPISKLLIPSEASTH